MSFWCSARAGNVAGTNGLGYSLCSLSGMLRDTTAGSTTTDWQPFSALVDVASGATLRLAALGAASRRWRPCTQSRASALFSTFTRSPACRPGLSA
ncbi:MAG: hypothetical protein QE285_18430 [Aquabacterium sp.]|nr:hypothetical protein [Aquabacterium sp.]